MSAFLSAAVTVVNYSVWPTATIPFHGVIRTTRTLWADLMDLISLVSYLTIITNSPLQKAFINGQRIYEMPRYFQARISSK
jgi:hypothetical protein